MAYILESELEADRLEQQEKMSAYSLASEFDNLDITKTMHVLDAGCGHGMASRFFRDTYGCQVSGCDFSDIRIAQAKRSTRSGEIAFFSSDLTDIQASDGSYDFVFSRYVFEYLQEPHKVCREFDRVLKKNGKLLLVDLDGVTAGLKTKDRHFNKRLKELCDAMPVDLFVGKKLEPILKESGFKILNKKITTHTFIGHELDQEIENIKRRFSQASTMLTNLLGEKEFEEFQEQYIYYIEKPESVYAFDKYWIMGER